MNKITIWRAVWLCGCLILALIPATRSRAASEMARVDPSVEHVARQWLSSLDAVPGVWQDIQGLTWFGRSLWLRELVLMQGLDEAAQQFTQAAPALDRVVSGPANVLLSGTVGSLHLVVQLQRSPQGVEGFASVLDVSAQTADAAAALPRPAWLPPHTQVHAAQWHLPDGSQVRQSVYVVPQTPAALRAHLDKVLVQQGWREGVSMTGPSGSEWQRGAERVLLLPDRSGQGSLLYQLLTTGESP